MAVLRLVVAEKQMLLREGIAQLLRGRGFDVVAQAGSRAELEARLTAYGPDAVLVDAGLDAAAMIRRRWPRVGVVVLAEHPTVAAAMALIDGDSRGVGYLDKAVCGDTIRLGEALRRVADRGAAVDPRVVAEVMRTAHGQRRLRRLSPRERSALALALEGRDDRAIGQALRISVISAQRHLARAFDELELSFEGAEDAGLRTGTLARELLGLGGNAGGDDSPAVLASGSGAPAVVLDHEQTAFPGRLRAPLQRPQP